jgi:hypothetical protein
MPVSRPTRPVDFSAVNPISKTVPDMGFTSRYIWNVGSIQESGMFRLTLQSDRPKSRATMIFIQENAMRKVLRGYAKDKTGNLDLIGTVPIPHSKDKSFPREREDKRHLVRQGATIFKKETVG